MIEWRVSRSILIEPDRQTLDIYWLSWITALIMRYCEFDCGFRSERARSLIVVGGWRPQDWRTPFGFARLIREVGIIALRPRWLTEVNWHDGGARGAGGSIGNSICWPGRFPSRLSTSFRSRVWRSDVKIIQIEIHEWSCFACNCRD